jgi:hypothetical protein
MRRLTITLLAVSLLTAGCVVDTGETTTTTGEVTTSVTSPASVTTTTVPAAAPINLRPVPPFADFPEIPLLGDDPAYAGPVTPTSLDGVLWADHVPEGASDLLTANGFVIVEGRIGQFHEAYSHVDFSARQPLFVTADAAYHYWHLAFAKALRDTEQLVLLPILEEFAVTLNEVATADADDFRGTSGEVEANRVLRYSELLLALLELREGPHSDEVESELALIRDHLDFAVSPTTGAEADYSLYRPRGHYTRTPQLTRYFLAMSSLGQTGFLLSEPEQVKTGLMLARAITGSDDLTRMWTQIYEPTAFLVGLADDFTPAEMTAAADAVDADWRQSPDKIDEAFVTDLVAELNSMRQVAIDPERASMRVMGARFVLDSFVLDQLVYPNVASYEGDTAIGRFEGSPLDVAASFGSDWAYQRQVEAGVPAEYPDYDPQLEKMTDLVADRTMDQWAGTVYDGWLYALQPMWSRHGAAYPDFMQTEAWAAKAHNTGFGSYTELKHDTLLYAKQAFAEGETPLAPAEPRHWVEPEPVVYARLAAVANLMRAGLEGRELLASDVGDVLDRLIEMYRRFERLARDELAGAPISADDNLWLETVGSRFELIWLLAGEDIEESGAQTGGFPESPNDIAAVIADIMSNPWEALEVGTGYIDRIYVLVPNDQGVFQVARGGVYSYYEFWVPRDQRLTDEEWRQMLVAGTQPDRPEWMTPYLVTEP